MNSTGFHAAAVWTGAPCVCVFGVCEPVTAGNELCLYKDCFLRALMSRLHIERLFLFFFLNRIFNDDWKILVKILLNVCFSVIWISTDVVLGNKEVQTFVGQLSGALSLGLVALGDILAPSLIPIYLNLPLTLLFHLLLSCQSIDFCNIDSFIYKHPCGSYYSPKGSFSAYTGIFTASTKPQEFNLLSSVSYLSQGILFISTTEEICLLFFLVQCRDELNFLFYL